MSDEETRTRIIEAADDLFYGRGIQAVGMDDLRAHAGVSLKKLYAIFPSKEAIVLADLEYRHRMWEDGIAQHVETASTPLEKLLAVYDYLAVWFDSTSFRGCGFINAFGELGATSPAVATAVREHKASFQRLVAELVAQHGGSPDLAAQLAILAEGAQTTAAIAGTNEAAGQARRAAETLIDADARTRQH